MRINKESVDRWYDYGLHIELRLVEISDGDDDEGIGPQQAERVMKAFALFDQTHDKPVRVLLNSKGGDWYHGMAIYDTIKASPCHVTVEVKGSAMSMGSIILQAADERVLYPNSTVMIHDGSDFFEGHARNMERWGDYSKVIRRKMYEIYAEKSGKDAKFWSKRCGHDYILTAPQAVELGLADKIYGSK